MRLKYLISFLCCTILGWPSGHGPVFGLATPTNPRGGWSLDYSVMGRIGGGRDGAMSRFTLGYGLTEDFKVSVSAPVVHRQEAFGPGRVAAFTPMGSNFEGLVLWRFHRQDTGVGSRFESTLIGGGSAEGGQSQRGGSSGALIGAVSGYASRSHYVWGGAAYQRIQHRSAPFWSAVYGYRPQSWRTDYPRWDWRLFGEVTGESRSSRKVFAGPSLLGVYKNIGLGAGVQFGAVKRDVRFGADERFRWALSLAYFF